MHVARGMPEIHVTLETILDRDTILVWPCLPGLRLTVPAVAHDMLSNAATRSYDARTRVNVEFLT